MALVLRHPSAPTVALACAVAVSSALSCSGGSGGEGTTAQEQQACFEAFVPQLADFRTWTSYSYEIDAAVAGNVHFTGPRTEWISSAPPHGSKEFPVGTMIVKEIEGINPDSHHIFAMVKRGCGFNPDGATGWEFLELTEGLTDTDPLSIMWRGTEPPPGETYAGADGCNTCHVSCNDNDSVCSPKIVLSSY